MKSYLVLLSALPAAYAWGASGHQAVGYVAMAFLGPHALSTVKTSLGAQYSESLGIAATWADEVKGQAAYRWSSNLHFVDAEDSPPMSCSVFEARDCGDTECILGAIANYTVRVVDTSLDDVQRQEALKFLDHFIGDLGQPLHVEAAGLGGNDFSVKCNGKTSNLHSVWDSGLINQLLIDQYGNSVLTWVDTLVSRIKTGTYRTAARDWLACSSTTTPALAKRTIQDDITGLLRPRAITPLECPLVWAAESNALDCSIVWNYQNFADLCSTSYYTDSIPIIETQIAKQGYRLAAWLNVLFDGSTEL